ncbi:TatD family deoxyribonuclease [Chloroflexia bacterium SDU3-3]|nr:TatD family deoxyribonuclease [Chloroflexia bacterium SDU3-3]
MTPPLYLDTHCHLGEYADPLTVLSASSDVFVIAVTEAPSVFRSLRNRVINQGRVRVALGAHPLVVSQFPPLEWRLFAQYLNETTYIGEVGLDFSAQGAPTRTVQEQAFTRVLQLVAGRGKMLNIHSRRAEERVLELLTIYGVGPTIFHWYSGPLGILEQILAAGHVCSVNPAMVRSPSGQKVIGRIPREQLLVETDGPYVRIGKRPAEPADVRLVYEFLCVHWGCDQLTAMTQVYQNFRALLSQSS